MPAIRILVSIAMVVIVAACGTSATPTSSSVAGATPGATIGSDMTPGASSPPETIELAGSPTSEPNETAEPVRWEWAQDPPRPLLMGSAVSVVVDELNLRARPSTAARRVGTVSRGDILVVSGPPIEADGYIWYDGVLASTTGEVPSLPAPMVDVGDPMRGWFAAWQGDAVYVAQLESRCPDTVDIQNVAAMTRGERLACFGDASIELEGTVGCNGCTIHIFGEYAPSWLSNPNAVDDLLWDVPMDGTSLMLRFPPTIADELQGGEIIRVRGHFDDSRASRCTLALAYPWADAFQHHPVPEAVARLLCRQEFVVESYDRLGTDPRFGSE
jgi:hypothetical protein